MRSTIAVIARDPVIAVIGNPVLPLPVAVIIGTLILNDLAGSHKAGYRFVLFGFVFPFETWVASKFATSSALLASIFLSFERFGAVLKPKAKS